MATTKNLLDVEKLQNQFVLILTDVVMKDPNTGVTDNYSQTGYLRGCDGIFIYYSFDLNGEISGMIPIDKLVDVVRIDMVEDHMMNPDDENYT